MKLPYIDLYIGDWLKDSVAGCSLAAQGLWLRLLFIMQESPERGRLLKQNAKQNGSKLPSLLEPIDEVCLSRRCGCSVDEFQLLMSELWDAGVPSIESGVLFSRRMVNDERLRKIRADAGRRGGKKTMGKFCSSKRSSKTKANADDVVDAESGDGNGLPPGFPKDREAAIQAASLLPFPADFVGHCWDKAHGRGGNDSMDIPIRNWGSHLATQWKYEQERKAKPGFQNGRTETPKPDHSKGWEMPP